MLAVITLAGSGAARAQPPAAEPAAVGPLAGEAIGVGTVTLAELRGEPTSVVLLTRGLSDQATPVGNALNSVMVELGGHRVSAVDLSDLWAAMRPLARPLLTSARADALERIQHEYAALGARTPVDLERRRAWLVADWTGTWRPALAPECRGLAVAYLDRKGRRTDVVCEPTAERAAARWRELIIAER